MGKFQVEILFLKIEQKAWHIFTSNKWWFAADKMALSNNFDSKQKMK